MVDFGRLLSVSFSILVLFLVMSSLLATRDHLASLGASSPALDPVAIAVAVIAAVLLVLFCSGRFS